MKNSSEIMAGDFYYHYKHDTVGAVNNFAYVVIGTALETELENFLIIYKPLYPNEQKLFARPIELFTGTVTVDNVEIQRFSKITDQSIINQLKSFNGIN